jgi:hypothetical protein
MCVILTKYIKIHLKFLPGHLCKAYYPPKCIVSLSFLPFLLCLL